MRYKNRKPKSVPAETFIRKARQQLLDKFPALEIVSDREDPTRMIVRTKPRIEKKVSLNELATFAHRLGWFIDEIFDDYLAFESYDAPTIIPEKFVYHETYLKNIESILKKGLIPGRTKGYSGSALEEKEKRIYVTPYLDTLLSEPLSNNSGIIRIDTEKLRKGVIFHPDEYEDIFTGFWTKSHIPPEALSYIGTVEELKAELELF